MVAFAAWLFEFPIALDGQGIVLQPDIHVLQADVRDIHLQQQLVLGLEDIDRRRPRAQIRLIQEAIHNVLKMPHAGHLVTSVNGANVANWRVKWFISVSLRSSYLTLQA